MPSEPWTAFDKDRPSIGRLLKLSSLTPQDCTPTTCSLAPDAPANRQATCPESGSLPVCFTALQERRRPPTLSECRFFAPSVCVRLSSMPVNPDASTHTSRVTLRLRQCAAIAVCRLPPSRSRASSAQPAIAAGDALAQPQEGHAQANAAGVRPSPVAAEDGVAGFGSGLPSIPASRPLLSRRRRTVTPKVSPPGAAFKERVALHRHPGSRAVAAECATPTPSLIRLRRNGGTPSLRSPVRCSLRSHVYRVAPGAPFSFETARRAAQPAQACLRWGRRYAAPWKDSTSPDTTTNNHTHLPQDRQDPHPHRPDPDPDAAPPTPLCA